MRIDKALILGIKKLKEHNIDSAELDAELLLCFILNKSKEFLYTYPEFELNEKQIAQFRSLIKKRSSLYPIAYILGYKEFYGLKFFVNKNVLIPRPCTELLVDLTLRVDDPKGCRIAEIGTGSGCIAISLAEKGFKNIIATDISSKILQIAKKNARFHKVLSKIKFIKGDLLKPLKNRQIDILIANLPYLPHNYNKSSIKYEPDITLYGKNKDGTLLYKKLLNQIKEYNFKLKYLLIEINPEQVKILTSYIKKIFPKSAIQTKKDHVMQHGKPFGLDRVMIITLQQPLYKYQLPASLLIQ